MKIAVVSEFTADEVAVKILVDAVLGAPTDLMASRRWRPRGWPSVINLLPTIIKDLHYNTDVEGLVVVVDSDDSPTHIAAHREMNPDCRLCQLQRIASAEILRLTSVPTRPSIKFAFGLAVPSIEAWYQCGLNPHVNEATWSRRLQGERITYDRISLKASAYGSDRVSNSTKTDKAREAAYRLTTRLDVLEALFPGGFGTFVRYLKSW